MLQKEKKQDYIVKAASALKSRGYGVKVILLGESRPGETEFEYGLRKTVAELGMENDVFLAGYQKNVEDYFALADVVVIPSVEGCPLTAIEAVCSGCSIVGRKACGTQEMIGLDRLGVVWEERGGIEVSCRELADCILKAYDYKQTPDFEAGRNGAVLRYSKENFEAGLERLFF